MRSELKVNLELHLQSGGWIKFSGTVFPDEMKPEEADFINELVDLMRNYHGQPADPAQDKVAARIAAGEGS